MRGRKAQGVGGLDCHHQGQGVLPQTHTPTPPPPHTEKPQSTTHVATQRQRKRRAPEHRMLRPFEHHLWETMPGVPCLQRRKMRAGRQAAGPGLEPRLFSFGLKSPGLFFYSLVTPGTNRRVESECASGRSHRLVTLAGTVTPTDSNREEHSRTPSCPRPGWPSAPAYLAGPELALRGLQAPLQGGHLAQGGPALPLAAAHALLLAHQACLHPAQPSAHATPRCGSPAPSGPARPALHPPQGPRGPAGLDTRSGTDWGGPPEETGHGGQGRDAGAVQANPTGPAAATKSTENRTRTQGVALTFFTVGHRLLQLPHP